jgi:hypothetical protein
MSRAVQIFTDALCAGVVVRAVDKSAAKRKR